MTTNPEPMTPPDIDALCADLCTVHWTRNDGTQYVINITPKQASDVFFAALQARARRAGYTIWMRAESRKTGVIGASDVVFLPGVPPRTATHWVVAGVLLLATIVSCLACGALYHGIDVFAHPTQIWQGWPFAATLLGILATHEMGHYVVGRLRGAPVSLPYFIPLPPPLSFTGTLGAVIVQREPMRDRRMLLDVGLAGPFAGLLVAVPLLFIGLSQSVVGPAPTTGYIQEGNSAFYILAKFLVFGTMLPYNGMDVQLNDVAFAAWIGLLVTMFNLLPIGQLDGGHAAYAVFGANSVYVAYGAIAFCLLLGIFVDNTWLVWGLIATLSNPRHPAPFDDVTRVGWRRIALAAFALLVLLFLLTPAPMQPVPALPGISG
ncbi:MAG: hypothetical protein RLZZ297_1563 [Chloroflexota bacterium]